ncbi:hypothetical protein [Vibrio lentus]|uniref:Uncharacterized protein n=1 Tax=Vibrio lentus TaxID=136468 RepID=A0A2N7IJ71_9VIBR|nr:hypothetical protein [Vibrio lentus]PML57737.1 hypothetical protein BCT74_17710 [Vibrio lentus]
MKFNALIALVLLCFSSVVSANDNTGIVLTSYDQPKSNLAVAFQDEAFKLRGISSRKLLMLEVYQDFEFDKVDLSEYDSILLVGEPVNVEVAMMELLGFGISANAVILDNIHGDLVVKKRARIDFEPDIMFANRLLNMIL